MSEADEIKDQAKAMCNATLKDAIRLSAEAGFTRAQAIAIQTMIFVTRGHSEEGVSEVMGGTIAASFAVVMQAMADKGVLDEAEVATYMEMFKNATEELIGIK